MSSVNFEGPYIGWNGSANVGSCWHKTPTMFGGGVLTADRNGGTISGSVSDAYCTRYSGSYGYPVYIDVNFVPADGSPEVEIASYEAPTGGNWSNVYFDFSITTNSAGTIQVHYICRTNWRVSTRLSRHYNEW